MYKNMQCLLEWIPLYAPISLKGKRDKCAWISDPILLSQLRQKLDFGLYHSHLCLFISTLYPSSYVALFSYQSVQFSHSVLSDSLWPHESQHARPPHPSPTPRVYSNSCPLIRWCHPAISSSVVPFSSCLQSLLASGSFPMSQLFAWGGQSIGVFSFSISPSNEHPGLISFRMDWLDLLAVQGTLKSLLHHHSSKASILRCSAFFIVQLSHPYMTTGKTIALTRRTLVGKVMSLLFNMLSRLVITFLPRSIFIYYMLNKRPHLCILLLLGFYNFLIRICIKHISLVLSY